MIHDIKYYRLFWCFQICLNKKVLKSNLMKDIKINLKYLFKEYAQIFIY